MTTDTILACVAGFMLAVLLPLMLRRRQEPGHIVQTGAGCIRQDVSQHIQIESLTVNVALQVRQEPRRMMGAESLDGPKSRS